MCFLYIFVAFLHYCLPNLTTYYWFNFIIKFDKFYQFIDWFKTAIGVVQQIYARIEEWFTETDVARSYFRVYRWHSKGMQGDLMIEFLNNMICTWNALFPQNCTYLFWKKSVFKKNQNVKLTFINELGTNEVYSYAANMILSCKNQKIITHCIFLLITYR